MNQIVVNATPTADQLWAGLRQVVLIVVPFLLGRHIINNDTGGLIVAITAIAIPLISGQLSTRTRAQQLITTANAAPDSVAIVKS